MTILVKGEGGALIRECEKQMLQDGIFVTTRNEFEEPKKKKVILQPRIRKGCKGCQNAETCAGVARGLFSYFG